MATLCQEIHCLPQAGGLLDQDSFLIYGIRMVYEAQGIKYELEQAQQNARSRRSRRR